MINYNTFLKADQKTIDILDAVFNRLDTESVDRPILRKYKDSLGYEIDEDEHIIIYDENNVCENAKEYIANAIKKGIKNEEVSGTSAAVWSRDCFWTPSFISDESVCVGDCYRIYDILKDRDISGKTYAMLNKYKVTLYIGESIVSVETVTAANPAKAREAAKAAFINKIHTEGVIEVS